MWLSNLKKNLESLYESGKPILTVSIGNLESLKKSAGVGYSEVNEDCREDHH